jgi:hypothetical protein
VLGVSDSFKITTYRRTAMSLGSPANCVQSAADRLRIRCMQHMWLAFSADAEWPYGLAPGAPAKSNALVTRP